MRGERMMATATTPARPPLPPFTRESAIQKVRLAEDGWNSRDPAKVALAYTIDSRWRNRSEFINGRSEIIAFLARKWAKELDYRLIKEMWTFTGNRIAVRFAYEWHDDSDHWYRSYGNENWEFNDEGLMASRYASINDLRISEADRKYHWGVTPFPASFHTQMVPTNGTSLCVRVGGKGPAVVLLHGFGFTGDMWAPLAIVLAKDHTVIVPDLRGMGMSDHPDTGYTKKNQAVDIAGVMDALKVEKADLVTHDIGNMDSNALAAQYPVLVTRWQVIDAPLPGIGDWDTIVRSPMLWHFDFRGPDEERLVQGRERIYLDRFWNELSADPKRIDEDTRQHFAALYARPHAMHDAFEQFGALRQDAADNKALLAKGGKITMPVFAIGAEKFFGKYMAYYLLFAASNVLGGIVLNSGHWIMEENPQATIKLVTDFLAKS